MVSMLFFESSSSCNLNVVNWMLNVCMDNFIMKNYEVECEGEDFDRTINCNSNPSLICAISATSYLPIVQIIIDRLDSHQLRKNLFRIMKLIKIFDGNFVVLWW